MKKLLFSIFLLPNLIWAAGPVLEFDLRKGVDFTTSNVFNQSSLNQLVDAGTISATNKGGIIRFSGNNCLRWPNVTDNPRYTNFLWIDTYTSPPTYKTYIPTGDACTNWLGFKPGPGSITALEILDYTIVSNKLATNAVMSYTIVDGSIATVDIMDGAITTIKLAPQAVGRGNIAFGAIQGGDITNKTITFTNIADNTIGPGQIANNAIMTVSLTNGAVTSDKILDFTIQQIDITNNAIGTLQITNGAVTLDKLALNTLTTNVFDTNVISGLSKGWGIISGTTILRGKNIASVLNPTTSEYKITFISAMPSTNYVCTGNVIYWDTPGGGADQARNLQFFSNTVSSVWVQIRTQGGSAEDDAFMFNIIDF